MDLLFKKGGSSAPSREPSLVNQTFFAQVLIDKRLHEEGLVHETIENPPSYGPVIYVII